MAIYYHLNNPATDSQVQDLSEFLSEFGFHPRSEKNPRDLNKGHCQVTFIPRTEPRKIQFGLNEGEIEFSDEQKILDRFGEVLHPASWSVDTLDPSKHAKIYDFKGIPLREGSIDREKY